MPLHPGHSKEIRDQNIKEMISAGHDPKQAVAAAYANQRKHQKMAEGGLVEKVENETNDQHHPENLPSEMPVDDEMVARAMSEKETGYAYGGMLGSTETPNEVVSMPESHFSDMAKKAIENRKKKKMIINS